MKILNSLLGIGLAYTAALQDKNLHLHDKVDVGMCVYILDGSSPYNDTPEIVYDSDERGPATFQQILNRIYPIRILNNRHLIEIGKVIPVSYDKDQIQGKIKLYSVKQWDNIGITPVFKNNILDWYLVTGFNTINY